MASNWYPDSKLASFAEALVQSGILEDSDEFVQFMRKPQLYDDMYDSWVEAGHPNEGEDGWDEFVDAISEDEEEGE